MNRYIFISPQNNVVSEIIPEFDPVFPDIPITERYTPDFLKNCIMRSDEEIEAKGIMHGKVYYPDTNEFQDPPEPEPVPEPEPLPEPEPAPLQPSEADELRTENQKLKAQINILSQQYEDLQDCILEMAQEVYA